MLLKLIGNDSDQRRGGDSEFYLVSFFPFFFEMQGAGLANSITVFSLACEDLMYWNKVG